MPIERRYIPELDSIRFLAFLLVFIHNFPEYSLGRLWQSIHEYGWIGVDLFFCISAYMITKILTTEFRQSGVINIKRFYIRRILRIFPLYYFYIAIAVLFIILDQGWNSVLPWHLIGITFFIYNFVYLFLTYKIYIVFMHLWSISYEVQFYLIIPFIIKVFQSLTKRRKSLLVFFLFITGSLIRFLFIAFQAKHPAIYMLPITHFEALLGGFLLGTGTLDKQLIKNNKWVVFLTGLICIIIVFQLPMTFITGWGLMLTYPLSGAGATFIVFFILQNNNTFIQKILNSKSIIYLGKISYGLYMYHLLAINLLYNLLNSQMMGNWVRQLHTHPFTLVIMSLLLTIIISSASYLWLEKPFLTIKLKYSTYQAPILETENK